jgi:hypothetical protein
VYKTIRVPYNASIYLINLSKIGLGIVGREKNIKAEVYSAFYGGQ